jgi:hypothetical protein
MKKVLASIFFVSLILLGTQELILASGRLDVGLRLGYTSGQLRAEEGGGDFKVEKFSLGGLALGVVLEKEFTSFFSVQPEVMYFQKGGKYDVQVPVGIPGISVNVKDRRRLNYIEIPILLKFSLPLRGSFKPTFLVGPSLGINLSAKLESEIQIQVPGMSFSLDEEQDIKKEANDTEFSFVIGGGFDWDLGAGKLLLDSRFFFGLHPNKYKVIVPASKFAALGFPMAEDMIYDLNMNNYVMLISVGYLF